MGPGGKAEARGDDRRSNSDEADKSHQQPDGADETSELASPDSPSKSNGPDSPSKSNGPDSPSKSKGPDEAGEDSAADAVVGTGGPDNDELDASTTSVPDEDPDRRTPYIGTYLYSDNDDEDDARYALAHQRGAGMWLPLVIFVVLLIGGALVGRFVLPGTPSPVAAPPSKASSAAPRTTGLASPVVPSLPPLPTSPARPADALAAWAGKVAAVIDVPVVAVEAYGYAQLLLQQTDPSCHLGWTTLAGIGEVESRHGQAGATLQPSGRSTPVVVGPVLNGKGGQELVKDTDAGAFDGDPNFDRAMGPLLLLPSMWSVYAVDADGDGILDPYDIDDSALAVGKMLCAGTEDLGQLDGWTAAIGRLHAGQDFAKKIFDAADSYGQRSQSIG